MESAYLKLVAGIVALAAGAGAVVFVISLIQKLPPIATPASSSAGAPPVTTTAPAPTSGFPTPPAGSVVLGAEEGTNALGLAVLPQSGGILLQASVVGTQGNGLRGLSVRFHVRGSSNATVAGTPCGPGCYRANAPVARPAAVTVSVGAHDVAFAMPEQWPAPSGAKLVADASRVYRGLHTLVIHDTLGDGHNRLDTIYTIVAPDRLSYEVVGNSRAIIIGNKMWYRLPHEKVWHEQPQLPVQQPSPFWVTAVDAHVLGSVSLDGRPAWKVSFFDPRTPGWYTLLLDKETLRTRDMLMTAHAHFMHDTYSGFDAPLSITPPSG